MSFKSLQKGIIGDLMSLFGWGWVAGGGRECERGDKEGSELGRESKTDVKEEKKTESQKNQKKKPCSISLEDY
jgi:hypothetical protein